MQGRAYSVMKRSVLWLLVILSFASIVVAQEEAVEAAPEMPQGIALGILLLGLLAVALVGSVMFFRDKYQESSESE